AGEFAAALSAQRVTAVDAAPEAVRRASRRGIDARLVALDGPLSFPDAAFDAVWLGETLEHLVDPVGALHEIRRVLRPRGRLLATTPDHPPPRLAPPPAPPSASPRPSGPPPAPRPSSTTPPRPPFPPAPGSRTA